MPDAPRPPESLLVRWRRHRPTTAAQWALLVAAIAGVLVVVLDAVRALAPLFVRPMAVGKHDWDQAEALRYLVVKSLKVFHAFPSWNPYACGGHPAWAAPEGDPNVVTPLLLAYLALPLALAMHVEIIVMSLVGAVGTWLLASRFTRSPGLRALAVVVFAFDGRWGMQLAMGHLWHLVFGLAPWVLFFLDRAIGAEPTQSPPRRADAVWAGVTLAFVVYLGGAQPWPSILALVVVYGVWLAVSTRSLRPLAMLGVTLAVAFGLSAPKLVPVLDVLARYPRPTIAAAVVSPEAMSLALLDETQPFLANVPGVPMSWWPEVGIYVGTLGASWLVLGSILAGGRREQPLRAMALVFVLFALGPFHEYAPWVLVRQLPMLSSQAMPSRWLYLAVLATACAAAGASEPLLARAGRRRPAIELLLVAVVAWVMLDVSAVARKPLLGELVAPLPATADSTAAFVTETRLPGALVPPESAPAPSLPAERANLGTIECNTFPGLSNYPGIASTLPEYDGRPSGIGAKGRDEPDYKGEAFLLEGRGLARVKSWTPDAVDVLVEGAQAGDHLVLDQNWDPGWHVFGADAWSYRNAIAATLQGGTSTVSFRYRSRFAWLGGLLFAATVAALVRARRTSRRGR